MTLTARRAAQRRRRLMIAAAVRDRLERAGRHESTHDTDDGGAGARPETLVPRPDGTGHAEAPTPPRVPAA